ncbi:hypothetical protein FJR48_07685 [Sulfurimonas lithotrophica]|uniref:Uncharacterized protein n=2 Tax=Sulfurimonas lithotrophica TaxID=2590022 RepID=A0A5P8P401_9BACT|nr:hypothetical protein FJR48_07685 [Sulfurimonas lithotrophica]
MYYNQLKREDAAKRKRRKKKSFASKEIEINEMVWAPEGYEGIFLFIYILTIPYITGAIFLFFAVAQADFDSFIKLNMTAFFIVWAIGYEIVATILLVSIFIMFLKYDDSK